MEAKTSICMIRAGAAAAAAAATLLGFCVSSMSGVANPPIEAIAQISVVRGLCWMLWLGLRQAVWVLFFHDLNPSLLSFSFLHLLTLASRSRKPR